MIKFNVKSRFFEENVSLFFNKKMEINLLFFQIFYVSNEIV